MMEKLRSLELHFADLEARLGAAETYADPALVARLNKEQRELEPVVSAYRAYTRRRQDMSDAQALMGDPDMKELAQEEFQQAKADLERLEEAIKILLLPRDPNDEKNVIVEIRAGVGGEEAALFAHSLFRMYSMYADARRKGGGQGPVALEQGRVAVPLHLPGELGHLVLHGLELVEGRLQHVLHGVVRGIDGNLGDEPQPLAGGDAHLPLVVVQLPGENLEQGGFACAVLAQKAHPLPLVHLKAQAV